MDWPGSGSSGGRLLRDQEHQGRTEGLSLRPQPDPPHQYRQRRRAIGATGLALGPSLGMLMIDQEIEWVLHRYYLNYVIGDEIPLEPPRAVTSQQEPGRGQLVSAAINVTRAFSQFLGAAIQ
ncbi:hypothetical protein HF086_014975, partial [Spodoptera exigua]